MSASDQAIATPAPAGIGIAARLDRVIGTALELVTASLVAVEIVILFVGIVARYVFHSPLIWSDELASMLCLWLAMLGGALALRRKEHMRMTAFTTRAPGHLRRSSSIWRCSRSSASCSRCCCRRLPMWTTNRSCR